MRTFTQKLAFLVLAMLCCVGVQIKAQENLTVHDGTTTNSSVPAYVGYFDDFTRTQCVFPAEELADMSGGEISSLKWYTNSSNIPYTTVSEVDIYLKEVDYTTISAFEDKSAATIVYHGTLEFVSEGTDGGAVVVTFDSPFAYSGGNLLIGCDNTTDAGYKFIYFYGEEVTGACVGGYNSSSLSGVTASARSFLPKTTFEYEPGGVTCASPTLVPSDTTAHGITLTWGGGSGLYNVEYKSAEDANWTSVLASTQETTTTLSNLLPNTKYSARVQSICETDSSNWRTINFKTLIGIPYAEAFASSAIPAGWARYTGDLADVMAATSTRTSTTSYWSFGEYGCSEFDNHAYISTSSYSTYKCWLATPTIPMEEDAQLTFELALSTYDGEAITSTGPNEKFAVVLYSPSTQTYTILRQWDNAGSEYVYGDIATEGEEVTIDLSAYTGQEVEISFYLEAPSFSGTNRYISVDNVLIDKIPTCFKPTELDVKSVAKNSVEILWTANTSESAWKLQYKKHTATGWPAAIDVASNPYTLEGLEAFTAYDVRIAAACDDGEVSAYSQVLSFRTAAGVPFHEGFASTPVVGWGVYSASLAGVDDGVDSLVAGGNWGIGSVNGVFPDSANHAVLAISGADCHSWLISPVIEMEENVQLTFDMALTKASGTLQPVEAGQQDSAKFAVLITKDGGESWERFADPGTWDKESADRFDDISYSANGQTVVIDLGEYAGEKVRIAFYGEAGSEDAENYLHLSNVNVDYVPDCEGSLSLEVSGVAANEATLSWDEIDGALWEFACIANPAASFVPADADFVGSTNESTVTLDTLAENTSYTFYLRRNCEGSYSSVKSVKFHTIQVPASLPYADDFEAGNNWVLINGNLTNAWAWGTATNNGGTHALYISNDGGESNAYNIGSSAMVYATKSFVFEEDATYTFKYDWQANGESTWDYLRVALVPASVVLEASSSILSGLDATHLPTGWIALDGGSKLNGVTAWQTFAADIELTAGTYVVVLAWRNDGSGGNQTPAAVDNFSVSVLNCARPADLQAIADSTTTNSVVLTWLPQGNESNWLIRYKKAAAADWSVIAEPAVNDTFKLEGLEAASIYSIEVAAWCDPTDSATISEYSDAISVITECDVVSSFPYSEKFDDVTASSDEHVLPLCWSSINTCTYYDYYDDFRIYPTVSASSPNSNPNALLLRSGYGEEDWYGDFDSYDPQDQYAILPEMEGISGLRIKLQARAYATSSYYYTYDATFTVGVMSDPADTATFVPVASFTPTTTTYSEYTARFDAYEGEGRYIAIKLAAANSSADYRAVYIDDIFVDEVPSCFEPTGSILVSALAVDSAVLAWVNDSTSWKYAYAPTADGEPADEAFVSIDTNKVAIHGLTEDTDYTFYLRRDCGSSVSVSISAAFHTLQLPKSVPFADDFEDGNHWLFINGASTNAWAYGEAVNHGGSHALYVSNDKGESNAYTTSGSTIVYATKLFNIADGSYIFKYDWKGVGESNYDYLRVALVPDSLKLTAGASAPSGFGTSTLPAGWVALDGGSKLNQKSAWQNFESDEISVPAGLYKVVFAWYNDNSGGDNPPAAVDNFSIRAIACSKPANLQVSKRTASSAVLSWSAAEGQNAWQVAIDTLATFNPDSVELIDVAVDTFYMFTGLAELKNYYVYVRANCGEEDGKSAWSARATFKTTSACEKPADVKADSITTNSALISWETFGLDSFLLRYRAGSTGAYDTISGNCPIKIDSLIPATTYQVQVKAACDTTNANWTSSSFNFTTDCEPIDTLAWHEGFENMTTGSSSSAAPLCWDLLNANDGSYPYIYVNNSSSYVQTGSKSLYFVSSASRAGYAIMPEFQMPLNTLRVIFSYRNEGTSESNGILSFGYLKDITADSTFVEIASYPRTTTFTEVIASCKSIPDSLASSVRLAFRYTGSSSNYYLAIDDITVEEIPACVEVSDIEISGRTANSAVISWTNGAEDQDAWQIAMSTDKTFKPEDELAPIEVTSNPFTLTELLADTTYYLYVRTNCGAGAYSAWSKLVSFKTARECERPDDLKADSITLNSARISWYGYGLTNFNLRYGQGSVWSDTIENIAMPYVLEGLKAGSAYNVQVQAACGSEWSSTISIKTAFATPFEEAFDASSKPADWNQYSGQLKENGTANLSSGSGWNFGTGYNGVFDSHAYSNIYGTGCYKWLATPSLLLTDSALVIFDLALTKFSGTLTPVTADGQSDDKFAVLISTNNGESWSVLRQWDNAGSEYVYDNIACSATGERDTIDISAYAGQSAIIAFYGESTVSNGDNNIHIDNVFIGEIPSCYRPTKVSVSEVLAHSAEISWTKGDSIQNAWQIAIDTIAGFDPDSADVLIDADSVPFVLSGLDAEKTYYFYVRANCGEGDFSSWSARSSFTTDIACYAPDSLMAVLTPGDGSVATIQWAAGDASAWVLEYSVNADFSDSVSFALEDASIELSELVPETKYYARVKAVCGGIDGESAWSTISFVPTDAYTLTVNEGTTTSDYVPVYGLWVDSYTRSQFVIPAAQLEAIQFDTINALTFYASQTSVDWGTAQFEVYMAEVPAATISDYATWSNLTKVMNAGSLSVADGQMVVELNAPYQYQGGNLLIGFKQTAKGTYKSSSWYGQTAPNASVAGYSSDADADGTATQRNFLPKMTITYTLGEVPSCDAPTDLNASAVTENSAVLNWTSDADAWELVYSESADFDPAEATPVAVSAKPYELGALNAETTYYFAVRSVCGPALRSAWSDKSSFATPASCQTIFAEADSVILCPGEEPYEWNDSAYSEAGEYQKTLTSAAGCDSIVTLVLSFYEKEDSIFRAVTIKEDQLPYTYRDAEYEYVEEEITFPEGTSLGEHKATAQVWGEHCVAVLELTLTVEKSQGIDDIFSRDGKKVQKVLYRDVLYIVINDEWYNAEGKKVNKPE